MYAIILKIYLNLIEKLKIEEESEERIPTYPLT
jgi:hypothetical protein